MRTDERRFPVFKRGHVRDRVILANFRQALTKKVNPETGLLFTPDQIALITQEGSRFWIEADAIDLLGQSYQQRAGFLADQVDPRKAADWFLYEVHGRNWVGSPLPASSGSGKVLAKGNEGTLFHGDSAMGEPDARVARDDAGKRYQVLFTQAVDSSGQVVLDLKSLDAGSETNPEVGETLTWESPPVGAQPQCTVSTAFTGGFDTEMSQEFADRIVDAMRSRPSSGNNNHFRAWAKRSSLAVERAYVYACAFHAGSVLVCVTQKRGTTAGPLARIPTLGVLLDATQFLVPPGSPVVPERVHVVVVPPQAQPCDASASLRMTRSSSTGWQDSIPWPVDGANEVANVVDPLHFSITGVPGTLPNGVTTLSGADAPSAMAWNAATSRFEQLSVASVDESSPGTYDVVLNTPAGFSIASGTRLSPLTGLHEQIAIALEEYFDDLGPGEVIDLDVDPRGERAYRFPKPSSRESAQVGTAADRALSEALGSALVNSSTTFSASSPTLPDDVVDGPRMLVLGDVSIFAA